MENKRVSRVSITLEPTHDKKRCGDVKNYDMIIGLEIGYL